MEQASCPSCFANVNCEDPNHKITCMECGREFRPSDAQLKQVDDIPSLEELMEQQYAEQDAAEARGEDPPSKAAEPEEDSVSEPAEQLSEDAEDDLSFEAEASHDEDAEHDLSFEAESSQDEPDLDLSFEAEAESAAPEESEEDGFDMLDMESESESASSEDEAGSDPFDMSFEDTPEEAPLGVEPAEMESDPEPEAPDFNAEDDSPAIPDEGDRMQPPPASESSKSDFQESEAAFQEIREFGEAISEGKQPPPPSSSSKVKAKPSGTLMAVAADHLEGFQIKQYLSPISMIVPVSMKDADPLAKGVSEITARAAASGANAIVGLRASFTPDGKSVLLVGSPVLCEPK